MRQNLQKRLAGPHTQRRDEYAARKVRSLSESLPPGVPAPGPEDFHHDHEVLVREALRNGEIVPPHVLAEYPHLHPPGVVISHDGDFSEATLGDYRSGAVKSNAREALARVLADAGHTQGAALALGNHPPPERLLDSDYEYAVIPVPGGRWVTAARLHGVLGPWLPAGPEADTPQAARESWEGNNG